MVLKSMDRGLTNFLTSHQETTVQKVNLAPFVQSDRTLYILREDQIHPFVSGNKFRKLKYNLAKAISDDYNTLLTFGGAYSNHIAAVAAAGKIAGLQTIGIIRGEELSEKIAENPTLSFAKKQGMKFHFISREAYKQKETKAFIDELKAIFGSFYMLPEGGTNALAVQGCEEIITDLKTENEYDYICVPVGTGGTMAGLVKASKPSQKVLGFSALKGIFQTSEVQKYTAKSNYKIIDDYCFGGYAKIDSTLIRFMNTFYKKTGIPLDPVYTGKMVYGIVDLLKNGYFKENSRIFAVHTGGLQGISGMNQLLKKKNLPQIEI